MHNDNAQSSCISECQCMPHTRNLQQGIRRTSWHRWAGDSWFVPCTSVQESCPFLLRLARPEEDRSVEQTKHSLCDPYCEMELPRKQNCAELRLRTSSWIGIWRIGCLILRHCHFIPLVTVKPDFQCLSSVSQYILAICIHRLRESSSHHITRHPMP